MGIPEIIFIAIGLAMDAFAVSICKGLSIKKIKYKEIITIGVYFAIFQSIMPLIGFLLGNAFAEIVQKTDHWIAFFLLGIIGINMIKDSFNNKNENKNSYIDFKTMILLSIATSIDALAVGVTFAFLKTNIVLPISIFGIVALLLSMLGVIVGNKFGDKFQNKAEFTGGIILILIGFKILLEHLGII